MSPEAGFCKSLADETRLKILGFLSLSGAE
jgi:hypothetical protein